MTDGVTESVRVLAGRYQLAELLGRGGMAEVYAGMDARLGRKVAVKLLKPSLANDPTFRTRFRQEAQAAARMAHPTIVRVFDAGEETVRDPSGIEVQVPFIVMEHVEGRLLRDVIAQGPVPAEDAVRIADGVLTALEYSHRAGVVHRDIKPGNIMVTSNGQVKVMDFGIARAISESSATIAQTSAILGTAQYFSPEQARGESVDARTDLYSTGVVLYELLTGRAPFRADTAVGVAYQHVSEAPIPPSTVNPTVSPALNAVVLRAMAKDRFERFQTAAEFKQDLDIAGAGKVPTRTGVGSGRVDEFNATLFGVNPNSASGSDATLRRLAAQEEERAPRSSQSRPPVAWIWGGVTVMAVIVVAVMVWVFSLQPSSTLSDSASVKIADVAGQTYDQGKNVLRKQKLNVTRLDKASSAVAKGNIIRTDPAAGETVPKSQPVTVWVSSGPAPVYVPSLLGKTEPDGIQALKDAGLSNGDTELQNSPTVAKGLVISTDPAAGTANVPSGTKVKLFVSSGNVTVPDVRGQLATDAQSTLSGADLQLPVKLTGDPSCAGQKVTKQSVTGDQPQGTAVELTYCSAG